ncbi:class A beta-lactamase [Roseibium sp. CAU 1637]|uniref:Beta-lactamase n=1 Tax=Roseibium limicola TaxID=2816037 RepID=A0A939EQ52_9HYPH|nr:class A beta-lactamase [Roseibium limicola]MBO0345916.1 class A beta-lactamase [Roseibium limicola]
MRSFFRSFPLSRFGKGLAVFIGCTTPALWSGAVYADSFQARALPGEVAAVEESLQARVGVSVVDAKGSKLWQHNADQRFPFNSTFKAFACAALLYKADHKLVDLRSAVKIEDADIVPHSPITKNRVGGLGITLDGLCNAAMTVSDNTAANIILDAVGGPEGFTAFMRDIGAQKSRLDRTEPELNEARPGDERDTTTPLESSSTLARLVFGNVLEPATTAKMTAWLVGNQVAGDLVRAGVPKGWKVGDRTGAGGYGSRSIIAVVWPQDHVPVVIAIYLTETKASFKQRNKAIAQIAEALAKDLRN